ncbi:unnamed protein product, partial [Sphenostylis stenocarpa]
MGYISCMDQRGFWIQDCNLSEHEKSIQLNQLGESLKVATNPNIEYSLDNNDIGE